MHLPFSFDLNGGTHDYSMQATGGGAWVTDSEKVRTTANLESYGNQRRPMMSGKNENTYLFSSPLRDTQAIFQCSYYSNTTQGGVQDRP